MPMNYLGVAKRVDRYKQQLLNSYFYVWGSGFISCRAASKGMVTLFALFVYVPLQLRMLEGFDLTLVI